MPDYDNFFLLKIRHHNKVLTCEVHGDGANEQRYMSYVTTSAQASGQCKHTWLPMYRRGGDSKEITRGPREPKSRGAARNRGCQSRNHPGQRLARPCGARLGGGMSGGYPHAGALRWAVWCGTCQKTLKIGRDRGGVLVQGAQEKRQSFTKRQVGSFWGLWGRG